MASPSSSNTNPMFNGLAPMIALKLTPNNYISWRTQMVPIVSIQQLLSHVDGSLTPPTPTILSGEKEIINSHHTSLIRDEQQTIILLNASLSEEVFSIIVGLSSAREIWVALEAAFCNASVERVQNLRDSLRALNKGDKSVADFARSFKTICDQLTAIGHPIDAMDEVYWFLCGLRTSFESFSTTTRSVRPIPSFVDLVASVVSHELFIKNLHGTLQNDTSNTLAFMAQSSNITNNNNFRQSNFGGSTANSGHQFRSNRSNYNTRSNRTNYNSRFGGQTCNFLRGQNKTNRPPFNNFQRPTCQLCNKPGHSAAQCFHLASFAQSTASPDQLAQAFHAQCQLNTTVPDWTSDTGATTHMLPNALPLQNTATMQGSTNQENASPRMS
ncbi:putative transcription factor interactor and regulator CCHC(Zn) family [Helianthus debilis subsp. tardiflorus]